VLEKEREDYDLIKKADRYMYVAREQGRKRALALSNEYTNEVRGYDKG
jgi:PleD family two-component response regulator